MATRSGAGGGPTFLLESDGKLYMTLGVQELSADERSAEMLRSGQPVDRAVSVPGGNEGGGGVVHKASLPMSDAMSSANSEPPIQT